MVVVPGVAAETGRARTGRVVVVVMVVAGLEWWEAVEVVERVGWERVAAGAEVVGWVAEGMVLVAWGLEGAGGMVQEEAAKGRSAS